MKDARTTALLHPVSDLGKARPQAATKAALSQTKAHSTSLLLKGRPS